MISLVDDKSRGRAVQGRAEMWLKQMCENLAVAGRALKNSFFEPWHEWQNMWLNIATNLPLGCHGVVNQYLEWPHVLFNVTPVVEAGCHYRAKEGLRRSPRDLHSRTRLSLLYILHLDLLLKKAWFHSFAVQPVLDDTTPNGSNDEVMSIATYVMCTMIATVLQLGFLRWHGLTQRLIMKVLPVYEWQTMKQLALCVLGVWCDGLIDCWSLESFLSLFIREQIFVLSIDPYTSSQ